MLQHYSVSCFMFSNSDCLVGWFLTCTHMMVQDDILPKLMTYAGSHEDLFRKEIAKYDHICEEIAQNMETQEQLLMQIQVCI